MLPIDVPHIIYLKYITNFETIFEDGNLNKNTNFDTTSDNFVYVSQSGVGGDEQPPPGVNESEMAPMTTEQITSFADQDAGWTTEKVGMYDPTMDLANNSDSSLGDFLQRPIRQSAQTWLVGQPLYYKFNP